MKEFEPQRFQPQRCLEELQEFDDLLKSSPKLAEKKHILPFFRQRRQLSAFIGSYNSKVCRFDLIAFEYDLFGDFVCDLVVGDSANYAFNFVEFEDASPTSVFVKRGRTTPDWSSRFQRGHTQLVDWFYKLDSHRDSIECLKRFGRRTIDYTGVLVIGRDQHLDEASRERLNWRRNKALIDSRTTYCLTFDELLQDLRARLELYAGAA